jgi:hypothetical protein
VDARIRRTRREQDRHDRARRRALAELERQRVHASRARRSHFQTRNSDLDLGELGLGAGKRRARLLELLGGVPALERLERSARLVAARERLVEPRARPIPRRRGLEGLPLERASALPLGARVSQRSLGARESSARLPDALGAGPAFHLGQTRAELVAHGREARTLRRQKRIVEREQELARDDRVALADQDGGDRLVGLRDELDPIPFEGSKRRQIGGVGAAGAEPQREPDELALPHVVSARGRAPSKKSCVVCARSRSANAGSSS